MTIHVGAKHQLTIPKEILKAARLSPGDPLEIIYEDDTIILRPQIHIPRDQAWFWTKEWQKGELEAEADIQAGRVTKTRSLDQLFRKLHRGRSK
jgi:AbrB family looped-hinge helix DNA binding protein